MPYKKYTEKKTYTFFMHCLFLKILIEIFYILQNQYTFTHKPVDTMGNFFIRQTPYMHILKKPYIFLIHFFWFLKRLLWVLKTHHSLFRVNFKTEQLPVLKERSSGKIFL